MARKQLTARGLESSLTQEELQILSGSDPVVRYLLSLGLPLTMENYLEHGYSVQSVEELEPEIAETVPAMFQEPEYSRRLSKAMPITREEPATS